MFVYVYKDDVYWTNKYSKDKRRYIIVKVITVHGEGNIALYLLERKNGENYYRYEIWAWSMLEVWKEKKNKVATTIRG